MVEKFVVERKSEYQVSKIAYSIAPLPATCIDPWASYHLTLDEAKLELTNILTRQLSAALDEVNELRAAIYRANNLTIEGVQQ